MQIKTFLEAELILERFLPSKLRRAMNTTQPMRDFLDYVGNPQDRIPAIHIAGTSGKSSTAYYAAACLQAAGKKVGLLVSPHIMQLNERVQVNGRPLPEKVFCEELSLFLAIVGRSKVVLTYSEILYAFAFWEFARQRVDCMVVEVGKGGLLDATNVMSRPDKLCIITDIGLDHTKTLGPTLHDITRHKAGIIQLHNTVFCYQQHEDIMREITAVAQQKQADVHILNKLSVNHELGRLPTFQQRNANLAIQAVQFWLTQHDQSALEPAQIRTVAETYIPGRMEIRRFAGKTIIIDGAHNVQKLQALERSIRQYFAGQPVAALVAFSKGDGGRDVAALLQAIQPVTSHLIATTLSAQAAGGHLFYQPAEIIRACQSVGVSSYQVIGNSSKAMAALLARPEPVLLITGSLYLPKALADNAGAFFASAKRSV